MENLVAVNIAAWLAAAFFCISLANAAMRFWRNLKGKSPVPPNEELEAGRRELERRIGTVEHRLEVCQSQHSGQAQAIEASAKARSAGIYQKIDAVRVELMEGLGNLREQVEKQFKDTERALGRIEGKLEK